MVKLTCGELASLFDVLADALSSDETPTYSNSGESERTLVLVLTMLCNCGKGISRYMESVMLRKILYITRNPRLPNCIKDVLVAVQEAKGYHDLVKVLNEFYRVGVRLYMIFAGITASFGLMGQPIQGFTIKVFILISPR